MNKNSYLCNFIANHKDNWRELLTERPYFLVIKESGPLAIFNYNMIAEDIIFENDEDASNTEITRWGRGIPLSPGDQWYEKSTPFAPDGKMYAVGATIDENGVVSGKEINCTRFSCDFSIPEVQEARGIIINTEKLEVVCWPFRKFGNYGESYVDKIDWSSARTQEKIDGSIIKLWWNELNNSWYVSTNGIIDADELAIVGEITFYKLFMEAAQKNNLDFSILNKNKTYIFELVGPLNRVVVKYDEVDIYHIGTRDNITGIESNDDIGVKKPKEYMLNSLDACVKAAQALCQDNSGGKFDVEHEGFVVVDGNWNRIKVKSPEYVMVHHALNGGILSKKKILNLILENEYKEYLTYFPQYEEVFDTYIKKIDFIKTSISETILAAKNIVESIPNATRKELATEFRTQLGPRAGWGFFYLDGKGLNEIFEHMKNHSLIKELDKIELE